MLFVLHAQGIGDLRWFETSTFLKITTCHVLSLLKIILQSLLSSLYRPVFFMYTTPEKAFCREGPARMEHDGTSIMKYSLWCQSTDGRRGFVGGSGGVEVPMPMPVGHGGVGGKALARRFEGLGPRRCCIGQPGWARHARMAGGDYDGDLNMFSFDKDLLDVVKATEDRIRQLPVEDLDQQDGTLKGNQFGKLSWPLLDCSCEWHRFTVHSFLQIFRRYSC